MMPTTKRLLRLASYSGLALSIVPAFLVFQEVISKDLYFQLIIVGMLLWFSTAVFWIKPDHLGG